MKYILLIIAFIFSIQCKSQGGIEHIKNQPYMQFAGKVDCNNPEGDNMTSRICANLKYQESDSLLTLIYKKVLEEQETDSMKKYIMNLQIEWRLFRDKHCKIIWDKYGGGSIQAIVYLTCLTELTDNRRKELEMILDY